jgi:hypothetical protein
VWLPAGILFLLIYPIQIGRLTVRGPYSFLKNVKYALFMVIGKFPELIGQIKFWVEHQTGKKSALIEYK